MSSFEDKVRERLEESLGTGDLISVHMRPDEPGTFLVGRILRLDDTEFLMWAFDTQGRYDGLWYGMTNCVHRVTMSSPYLRLIETKSGWPRQSRWRHRRRRNTLN